MSKISIIILIAKICIYQFSYSQDFSNSYNPKIEKAPLPKIKLTELNDPFKDYKRDINNPPILENNHLQTEKYNSRVNLPVKTAVNTSQDIEAEAERIMNDLSIELSKPTLNERMQPRGYDPVVTNRDRYVNSPCFPELGFNPMMDPDTQAANYKICEEGKKEKGNYLTFIILVVITIVGIILILKNDDDDTKKETIIEPDNNQANQEKKEIYTDIEPINIPINKDELHFQEKFDSPTELMKKFSLEKLVDSFYNRFTEDYGMLKTEEIIKKINESAKINNYLTICIRQSLNPTKIGVISTLNNIPYFIFSKGETLCMAALFIVLKLENECFYPNVYSGEQITRDCAIEIIKYCEKIKLSKENSIFSRYYIDLKNIEQEGKNFWN